MMDHETRFLKVGERYIAVEHIAYARWAVDPYHDGKCLDVYLTNGVTTTFKDGEALALERWLDGMSQDVMGPHFATAPAPREPWENDAGEINHEVAAAELSAPVYHPE